jgi:hypothetical protein
LAGGGNWVFDDDGSLVAQRTESVPVSFIFPHGAMPAQGWPLVVVVPGTNQTHEFLLESEFVEPMGMGTRGFAAAAKANPLHPDRDPSVNGFLTYNYEHPIAFRDNIRQSVVEQTLFLRALLGSTFSADLCPGSDTSAAEDGRLRFDESRVGATGQSLGSVILHNWAPLEPLLGAVAPTGAGGHYPLMLENPLGNSAVQTAAIIVRSLLGVAADALLDPLAPTAQVGQMALEPVDPVALASRIAQRPLPGVGAKHWYHPAGYIDSFFSPDSIRALVGPIAPALAGEEVDSSLFDLADLAALSVLPYPVTANVDTPDGPRTSVVVQYLAEDYDGHGVVYLDPRAQHQIGCFFETYFATGTPVVSAPRTALEPCSGP